MKHERNANHGNPQAYLTDCLQKLLKIKSYYLYQYLLKSLYATHKDAIQILYKNLCQIIYPQRFTLSSRSGGRELWENCPTQAHPETGHENTTRLTGTVHFTDN